MAYPHYRIDVWPGVDRALRVTLIRVDESKETPLIGRTPEQGPVSGTILPADATLAELQVEIDHLKTAYWDDPDLHD